MAEDAGLQITGLHWLLLVPEGLSLTSPDRSVRSGTLEVMKRLVGLCAELGGRVLIHGSPKQRMIEEGDDPAEAEQRALELLTDVAVEAENAGVIYCIEALTSAETNFVNTLEDAARLVEAVGNPAFRTMLDTKAASGAEKMPVPELIDRWLPTGVIAHVHLNDRNLRGPGQGEVRFAPILSALRRHGYNGVIGVEPFDYYPDPRGCAARAIGYLRGILEAQGGR